MDDIIRDPDHLPSETVRLPERGFTIDRHKALVAAALCWGGFAIMAYLVTHGLTGDFDRWGLLSWRTGEDLHPRGPELIFESVRDVTALGGVFLRNLFALAAVVALLFLKLRREAFLYAATVIGGWPQAVGWPRAAADRAAPDRGGRRELSLRPQLQRGGGVDRHGSRLCSAQPTAFGALYDHRRGDGAERDGCVEPGDARRALPERCGGGLARRCRLVVSGGSGVVQARKGGGG